MITITKQNDGVLFTFQDSDKYLYGNGSILVPFNTLSIVADESDMITLKKAASNDVFLSARYDTDLGYRSKDDAIDDLKGMLFAETGGGGSESGITSGEVQTMIDNSLEDYYTDDEVDAALSGKADASALTVHADNANVHFSGTQKSNYDILEGNYHVNDDWDIMPTSAFYNFTSEYSEAMGQFDQRITANASAIATKADTSAVTAVANDVQTVSGQVQTKVATSDFNTYTAATATAIGNKQDALVYYSETDDIEYGSKGSDIAISQGTDENNVNVTFGVGTIYTEDEKSSGVYIQTDIKNDDGIVGSHINVENGFIDISNEYTPNEGELSESHIYMSNNGSIEIGNSNENGGTLMYIQPTGVTINDERVLTEGDVTSAITSASTNSEIPTAKATYDAIQAGGGGGATYSAGTNISIDTANTINCTLPITVLTGSGSKNISVYASTNRFNTGVESKDGIAIGQANTATTGNYVVMLGQYNKASGDYTFVQGERNEVMKDWSAAFGRYSKTNNYYEFATGAYNNSVTGSTDADKTLFSVGNGTGTSARHNAFEIRKNGDIYITSGNTDIKLQDHLGGGGGGSVTVDSTLDSGSTNPVANSAITNAITAHTADTTVHVTAANKNSWNNAASDAFAALDALGGIKLQRISQAFYDQLVNDGETDPDTLYIISNVVS